MAKLVAIFTLLFTGKNLFVYRSMKRARSTSKKVEISDFQLFIGRFLLCAGMHIFRLNDICFSCNALPKTEARGKSLLNRKCLNIVLPR